jgi:hypothetical protein
VPFKQRRERTQRRRLGQRASPLTPVEPAGASGAGAGAAAAATALAALKDAVQAAGRTPKGRAAQRPSAGRAPRARAGPPRGPVVVVLDEMDQLLAGDQAVLTELFLLPKVPLLPPSGSPLCCPQGGPSRGPRAAHKEQPHVSQCAAHRERPHMPHMLPSRRHRPHSSREAGHALSASALSASALVASSPQQPGCRAMRGREAAA